MSGSRTMSDERRERAASALGGLGIHRSDHQRLIVQCQHGHHLAAVYLTHDGLVYVARTGPHSHGSRDRIDTGPRGSRGGEEFVDLLEAGPAADDALPAWCDCGSRTLSRSEMVARIRARTGTFRVA